MAAYSFGIFTCLSAIGLAALAVVMFLHDFKHQFYAMLHHGSYALLAFAGAASTQATSSKVDLSWYPPKQTQVNNLTAVMAGEGTYGWIYNSSETPDDRYGTYNWCNMPHVRKQEYTIPSSEYNLIYVELIHRHHKRTPYSSNSFPVEPYPWNCDDVALFYHSQPLNTTSAPPSIPAYWKIYTSPISPFTPQGWTGTCQFPQITLAGLSDSHRHGSDLFSVYDILLSLSDPGSMQFRVTTNPITTQVAGAVLPSFFTSSSSSSPYSSLPYYAPLLVQPPQLDSLEPKYRCPLSSSLFSSLQSTSNPRWRSHLSAVAPLFRSLDSVSGVPAADEGFHASLDHYYDNLSARQCHGLPLPCSLAKPSSCITQAQTDLTYRLGQWEYDHVYRSGGPDTLKASLASMGVWFAELAENLRGAAAAVAVKTGGGKAKIRYRHNIAHDGSLSRVLSVLQVDEMVWPGMGAEVVFELYEKTKEEKYFVRVLWGGKVLRSSNPSLGVMDMVDLDLVLGYFDGLVGEKAGKVKGLCGL